MGESDSLFDIKIDAFELELEDAETIANIDRQERHIYHGGAICETDSIGYATPDGKDIQELVLHAGHGFIPLWKKGVTLNWRFDEISLRKYKKSEDVKLYTRKLLSKGVSAWKGAAPIKFNEAQSPYDFEVVIRAADSCSDAGCTLARAFFPGRGQNKLILFPRLFKKPKEEQVQVMAHELGHIFGLRHFFAKDLEQHSDSEIFGKHNKFSIMNYGKESVLTDQDTKDLRRLYSLVWSGKLSDINGTGIRTFWPYSYTLSLADL